LRIQVSGVLIEEKKLNPQIVGS